jgi:hypothetical protein
LPFPPERIPPALPKGPEAASDHFFGVHGNRPGKKEEHGVVVGKGFYPGVEDCFQFLRQGHSQGILHHASPETVEDHLVGVPPAGRIVDDFPGDTALPRQGRLPLGPFLGQHNIRKFPEGRIGKPEARKIIPAPVPGVQAVKIFQEPPDQNRAAESRVRPPEGGKPGSRRRAYLHRFGTYGADPPGTGAEIKTVPDPAFPDKFLIQLADLGPLGGSQGIGPPVGDHPPGGVEEEQGPLKRGKFPGLPVQGEPGL